MTEPPRDPFAGAQRNGRRFRNASGQGQRGGLQALRWLATRKPPPWPAHIANVAAPRPLERVTDCIRATLVGHATVLLQVAGLNILTDPVWSDRVGPLPWLGPARRRPPALAFSDLPPIDVILLSHSHYDHLDKPTLARLQRPNAPPLLTGLNVGPVTGWKNVVEMDWWQRHPLSGDIAVTYVPAEHASARGPLDRDTRLWGGFVIETPHGAIYFAGDTGAGLHFEAIRARFGPMALSLLPIGAYLPRAFMAPVHMDPFEAVAAAATLQSRVTLPIHYGTFQLADDPYDEPLRLLREALAARGEGLDFRVVEFGEAVAI